MKGKYSLSKKFYEDKKTLESVTVKVKDSRGNEVLGITDVSLSINDNTIIATETFIPSYTHKFLQFIQDAKVPDRLDDGKGNWYDCNKYSEPAMKAFKNIIEKELINYNMLVKSTTLYYASGTSYKKKISNYILDGDWRSDYMKLEIAANTSEDALKEHIKKEIDDGTHDQWSH